MSKSYVYSKLRKSYWHELGGPPPFYELDNFAGYGVLLGVSGNLAYNELITVLDSMLIEANKLVPHLKMGMKVDYDRNNNRTMITCSLKWLLW
jgi:hypothetical protein